MHRGGGHGLSDPPSRRRDPGHSPRAPKDPCNPRRDLRRTTLGSGQATKRPHHRRNRSGFPGAGTPCRDRRRQRSSRRSRCPARPVFPREAARADAEDRSTSAEGRRSQTRSTLIRAPAAAAMAPMCWSSAVTTPSPRRMAPSQQQHRQCRRGASCQPERRCRERFARSLTPVCTAPRTGRPV
jgi:hypothetical protein